MSNFGERIKAARKEKGISQRQLSSACGWGGQSRVGHYEQGARKPSLTDIQKIASALDRPVSYFFGESAEAVRSQGCKSCELDTELLELSIAMVSRASAESEEPLTAGQSAKMIASIYKELAEL